MLEWQFLLLTSQIKIIPSWIHWEPPTKRFSLLSLTGCGMVTTSIFMCQYQCLLSSGHFARVEGGFADVCKVLADRRTNPLVSVLSPCLVHVQATVGVVGWALLRLRLRTSNLVTLSFKVRPMIFRRHHVKCVEQLAIMTSIHIDHTHGKL